jgi:hypothetical protein
MGVKLKVPFITQLGIGSHAGGTGRNDPTGCWYASASMVGYYFEAGPRQGVPELYKRALGGSQLGHYATGSQQANTLEARHHDLLADRENLAPVAKCATAHSYTIDEIENLLRMGGPIFMYWMKTHGSNTYGHASVIIGTQGQNLIYHDPENAPDRVMAIGVFNSKRQTWKYALMQRKGGAVAARKAMFGG